MVQLRGALVVAAGVLTHTAEARTHAKPAHVLKMKQRPRPIKDEQDTRVTNLHRHMRDLKLAKGIASDADTTYDSVTHESEAYYAYPLTLDYVVDVAFQNGTSGNMVQYPVIVDTGSSNLAVAVDSCTNCDTGATSLELGWYSGDDGDELCIDVTYGSGSWDGMMSSEIQVGFVDGDSALLDDVYVAGITSSDGFFCGGFYGILGLAYSGLTESYSTCSSGGSSGGGSSGGGSSGGNGGGRSAGNGGQPHQMSSGGQSQQAPRSQPAARQPQQNAHAATPQAPGREGHMGTVQPSAKTQTRSPQPATSARGEHGTDGSHPGSTIPGQVRHTHQSTAENGFNPPASAPKHPRELAETEVEEAGTTMSSTPLLDSFYEDGLVTDNVFSILFCGDLASMAIGGVDTSQISDDDTQGLTYVTTQKTYDEIYGYFLVEVDSVSVADTVVSTDSTDLNEIGGVLVDSGTTLIYLPSSVTSAIETKVQEAVSSLSNSFFQWSSCVEADELSNFPDLTLSLDGYDLVLSPYQYLLWYSDCYYWGISSSSIPIIGNVALQGKLVVFDKEANQLGFADGDCSAYGGTSFDTDDTSSSSSTAQTDAVRQQNPGGQNLLEAAQDTVTKASGAFVAAGALVIMSVGLVVARMRASRNYSSLPEYDEMSI